MYKDNAFIKAGNKDCLIDILSEIQRLSVVISDLEWDGHDVYALRQQLVNLKLAQAEGADFVPRF